MWRWSCRHRPQASRCMSMSAAAAEATVAPRVARSCPRTRPCTRRTGSCPRTVSRPQQASQWSQTCRPPWGPRQGHRAGAREHVRIGIQRGPVAGAALAVDLRAVGRRVHHVLVGVVEVGVVDRHREVAHGRDLDPSCRGAANALLVRVSEGVNEQLVRVVDGAPRVGGEIAHELGVAVGASHRVPVPVNKGKGFQTSLIAAGWSVSTPDLPHEASVVVGRVRPAVGRARDGQQAVVLARTVDGVGGKRAGERAGPQAKEAMLG